MKIDTYNWGRVYAAIEYFLPKAFSRVTLERASQAPMYYFEEWFILVKQHKDYDPELFKPLIAALPKNGGVPTPTVLEDRASFFLGLFHQRGEMMVRRNNEDAAERRILALVPAGFLCEVAGHGGNSLELQYI